MHQLCWLGAHTGKISDAAPETLFCDVPLSTIAVNDVLLGSEVGRTPARAGDVVNVKATNSTQVAHFFMHKSFRIYYIKQVIGRSDD